MMLAAAKETMKLSSLPGYTEFTRIPDPSGIRRAHFVRIGAIAPLSARTTLAIDSLGEAAAAQHIAEYLADPEMQFRPFVPNFVPPYEYDEEAAQ